MPTCPHCGFELDFGVERCPLCGTPRAGSGDATRGRDERAGWDDDPTGPGRRAGPSPEVATSPEGGAERDAVAATIAWEDPAVPFPADMVRTWRRSVFEPSEFFREVPWGGSLARPVLYYLIVAVVAALFTLWWRMLGVMVGVRSILWQDGTMRLSTGADAVLEFFVTPFAALVGLLVWTLILHVLVVLLAPQRRGLAATARGLCYSYGPAVFAVVPVAGALVGLVWTLVLEVVALREAHRTTTGRAVAIVLLPLAALAVLLTALVIFAVLVLGLTAVELLGGG